MAIDERIAGMHEEMTKWRRDLHAYPEPGFEETRTAGFVAEQHESLWLEVHRGIGRTDVVGVLRADMDALPLGASFFVRLVGTRLRKAG